LKNWQTQKREKIATHNPSPAEAREMITKCINESESEDIQNPSGAGLRAMAIRSNNLLQGAT
jgi:hypothetical protein